MGARLGDQAWLGRRPTLPDSFGTVWQLTDNLRRKARHAVGIVDRRIQRSSGGRVRLDPDAQARWRVTKGRQRNAFQHAQLA